MGGRPQQPGNRNVVSCLFDPQIVQFISTQPVRIHQQPFFRGRLHINGSILGNHFRVRDIGRTPHLHILPVLFHRNHKFFKKTAS